MNKFVTGLILLSFVNAPFVNAEESMKGEMNKCRAIQRDLQRLVCYDNLSDNDSSLQATAVISTSIKSPDTDKALTTKDNSTAPDFEGNFGLSKPESETSDNKFITSSIVSVFKGWKYNTTLTLANGQVWKVKNTTANLYLRAEKPKVKINSTGFGSYRLTLVDYDRSVVVSRVK